MGKYDLSIFDELRIKYLKIYKEIGVLNEEFELREKEKFIPHYRLESNKREASMQKQMVEIQHYGIFK